MEMGDPALNLIRPRYARPRLEPVSVRWMISSPGSLLKASSPPRMDANRCTDLQSISNSFAGQVCMDSTPMPNFENSSCSILEEYKSIGVVQILERHHFTK